MKKLLILLTLFMAGCITNDPPAINPPAINPPAIDPPTIDPPAFDPPAFDPAYEDPSIYTANPSEAFFLPGKVFQLESILDIESNTVRELTTGDNPDSYSMLFNSDSTANGKIMNTEMQVSLFRPFFHLSGEQEDNEEAQLFAQIASGITGCWYNFEGNVMKFYNKENKNCLVFKFKSVRDKTGSISYDSLLKRWAIHGRDYLTGEGHIFYDSGDEYFPDDIPDELKKMGQMVKFSGDVTRVPCIETDRGCVATTISYYLISLSSLEKLPL
ncbi:MAG: hypothetical protein LBK65_00785 [Tannerellaceae bacterium]|nr:hypothetical protein [Tannerellaceae bacterium]